MPSPECISDGELKAFLLGDLPARQNATIARHLEICPICEAAAQRLDTLIDPVIRALRGSVGAVNHENRTLSFNSAVGFSGVSGDPSLLPIVPGYTVLKELARTASSIVYEARQTHPNRPVALKMLLAGVHAGVERRSRLLAEADAIARLRHSNIVQVYDVGHLPAGEQAGGIPFLALEYMERGSLALLLGGTPLPPLRAATLLETLAHAVQHAHEHGVVHRDLKPANVLLTKDGTPKVADFGLARHERPELTATGAIMGTPSYMAPEQAAGDNPAVGPRADVYALGAILYECLTGRPPFRGDSNRETIHQALFEEPVAPSQLRTTVPRDLETMCLKCLEKEQTRRYTTAQELADDLGRFVRGEPVRARPLGRIGRGWRWCRRKPALALLLSALLTVMLTGTIVSSSLAWWALDEADTARTQTQVALKNADQARRQQQYGERQLYLAHMSQLRMAWNESNLARARELLDATRPIPGGQDCRQFEWFYYERALNADLRTFKLPESIEALAVSPDGRRVALGGGFGKIVVGDVKSGQTFTFELPNGSIAYASAFSPDGTRLACGFGPFPGFFALPGPGNQAPRRYNGGGIVWELETGKVITRFDEPSCCLLAVAFSPDGKQLAETLGSHLLNWSATRWNRLWQGGQVRVRDATTGKAQLTLGWASCDNVAFSPDGKRLLAGRRFQTKVWNFADGRESELNKGGGNEWILGTSREGQWLALGREYEVTVSL